MQVKRCTYNDNVIKYQLHSYLTFFSRHDIKLLLN